MQKQNNRLMPWRPYKTIVYVDIAGHPSKYNSITRLLCAYVSVFATLTHWLTIYVSRNYTQFNKSKSYENVY